MSHVFPRVLNRTLPTAVSAEGAWIVDADGRRYLDGAGGAIVVGVGHGDRIADRRRHGAARRHAVRARHDVHDRGGRAIRGRARAATCRWTTRASIRCRAEARRSRPRSRWRARTTWRAATTSGRTIIARRSSYHGNTLGALDASGKEPIRKPYTAWLGRFLHAPAAYEYRCGNPQHPDGCGAWHAAELERMISLAGADTVAAFIAEPVGGATLAGAVPTDDYWPAIVEVCRRHGILVIADEVMTGFGTDRTLVRRGPLGRPTRHPHRGQGDDERLRAVRVRGGERRGLRHGRVRRVRPRVHVVAQRAGRGGRARGHPPAAGRRLDRAERGSGRTAPARTWASRSTATRPSATCAGSA